MIDRQPLTMSAVTWSRVHDYVTLHRATLNRATVKRQQFTGRHLTGLTVNRSDN